MNKTIHILAVVAILTSTGSASPAERGDNAVSESRSELKELWSQSRNGADKAVLSEPTLHSTVEANLTMSDVAHPWADNYAAGRVHEPSGHDGN